MTNLQDMLSQKWDSKIAFQSSNRWLRTKQWSHLQDTYGKMLPLLRSVCRHVVFKRSREDIEEIESMVSYRLWRVLRKKKYPQHSSASAFESWWRVVLSNMIRKDVYAPTEGEVPRVAEDYVLAKRALNGPRDGAAIATEATIYLEELPDAIWRSAASDLTMVKSDEAPVLRYIIHSIFAGRRPRLRYLNQIIHNKERLSFLQDYAILSIRDYLKNALAEYPELILGHPVSFIVGEDDGATGWEE